MKDMNMKNFILGALFSASVIFCVRQYENFTKQANDCYTETDDGFLDIMVDSSNHNTVLRDKKLCKCSSLYIDGRYLELYKIEKIFSKCDKNKIKRLYVSEGDINDKIVKNIANFHNLESLILEFSHEKMPIVPEEIFTKLEKLKYCRIKMCQNDKLPFTHLKNLEELEISDCPRLTNISEIGKLSTLKKLDLININILELPTEIAGLSKLESLSIISSSIRRLPNELFSLSSLKRLDLHANIIAGIPEFIGNLNNLEYFNISDNAIRTFPKEIGKLVKLKELHANRCYLTEIPEEIGELEKLDLLSISFNFLTNLPPSINKLKNLKRVYMHGNDIDIPVMYRQ